jgi:hypothetical protein
MEDFMPCKGCDEPEACSIQGRCLEPAAQSDDVYSVVEVQHRGMVLVSLRTDEQPLTAKVGDLVTLRPAGVDLPDGAKR